MSVRDKAAVALVTGGSRGIGRATALAIARAGCGTVVINYLQDHAAAELLSAEITALGVTPILMPANVGSPDDIDRMFGEVRRRVGRLDAFVHCAALTAFKPLVETRPNQWDLTMNINARGFLLCAQRAAELMTGGAIVAVSSLGASRVVPDYGAMGPTKAALEAIVRYLAVELAPRGIQVNAIAGGLIETTSLAKFSAAEQRRRDAVARTPHGRIGTPEDIAEITTFLLSPAARWICGQTIVADGGFSLL